MPPNTKNRRFKDYLLLFIKGVAMGAANKIPGVSGGIVAFVAGFYPEMIHSLKRMNLKFLKLLLRKKTKLALEYANVKFLSYLFLGSLFSYFGISQLLDLGFTYYEKEVWGLFFGLILTSLYYVYWDIKVWNFKTVVGVLFGIGTGLLITLANPGVENDQLWMVFICGMVGIIGMTMPGLSGSFLILVLGNYNLLLVDSVNHLFDIIIHVIQLDFSIFSNPTKMHYLIIMIVFGIGSVIGLVFFSNLLSYVLKRYQQMTTATIIGFIAGTIFTSWPWKHTNYKVSESGHIVTSQIGDLVVNNYEYYLPNLSLLSTYTTIGSIVLGCAILVLLQNYGSKK
ncbi:MAG: DUF368 domain-containing protein [Flavobacteriaceae bacterium]|nr:DUF368 domain-containing protein [Flavobacteriaceae bacterium]MCY4268089.1 DUF368 domain-containing protein [Flavobacteriaceae bacterium]MCY4298575.1 DUF368 domain-containing protein [Flavobacteriaceae bacterium]